MGAKCSQKEERNENQEFHVCLCMCFRWAKFFFNCVWVKPKQFCSGSYEIDKTNQTIISEKIYSARKRLDNGAFCLEKSRNFAIALQIYGGNYCALFRALFCRCRHIGFDIIDFFLFFNTTKVEIFFRFIDNIPIHLIPIVCLIKWWIHKEKEKKKKEKCKWTIKRHCPIWCVWFDYVLCVRAQLGIFAQNIFNHFHFWRLSIVSIYSNSHCQKKNNGGWSSGILLKSIERIGERKFTQSKCRRMPYTNNENRPNSELRYEKFAHRSRHDINIQEMICRFIISTVL